MAIALRQGAGGNLQRFQVGESLQIDSVERLSSSGNLVIGSGLSGSDELRLCASGATTRVVGDLAVDEGIVAGDTYDAANHDIDNIKVAAFNGVVSHGNMGTTETFDWTQGNKHSATNSATCTISFTAPPGPTVLHIILTNGGAFTLTWPAAVDWAGGAPPSFTTSGVDIVALFYDGTTYYAVASLNFS
jgi:hypothetical protein